MKKISLIVPCYNEEACLHAFAKEADRVITQMPDYTFEILFVNDGSKDNTLQIIRELACSKGLYPLSVFFKKFRKRSCHVCRLL